MTNETTKTEIINLRRFLQFYPKIIESQSSLQIKSSLHLALEILNRYPNEVALKKEVLGLLENQSNSTSNLSLISDLANSTKDHSNKPESLRDYFLTLPATQRSAERSKFERINPQQLKKRHSSRAELLGEDIKADKKLDKNEAERLRINKEVQEDLTKKLIDSVERLKEQSKDFSSSLQADAKELLKTSELLDQNQTRIEKDRKAIKVVSGGTWNTTFMVWISLLLFLVIFLSMFLFIKIFSAKRNAWDWSSLFSDNIEHQMHSHSEYIKSPSANENDDASWDDEWF